MKPGATKTHFRNKKILTHMSGLLPTDFETLQDIARLDNAFGVGAEEIYMTQEALDKYQTIVK